MINNEESKLSSETYDLREFIKPYKIRWKWFVLALLISLASAILYIRYAVPQYAVEAKILIENDENSSPNFDIFENLAALGGGPDSEIADEMEILTSRSNLITVIKELGLNVVVSAIGNIKKTDLYRNPDAPFNINFLASDSLVYNSEANFYITLLSETSFMFSEKKEGAVKKYSFGNTISSSIGDLIITPTDKNIERYGTNKYIVSVLPISLVAEAYQEILEVSVSDDQSKIITILLEDPLINRAEDIINKLIRNFNNNSLSDNKAIADRTSDFIDERIRDISSDLSDVDETAVEFRTGKGLANIGTQTDLNLTMESENQQLLNEASIKLDIASSMLSIIHNEEGYELLPSNIGLEDPTIAATTQRYNEVAMERRRLLESSNDKNPIIVNLDRQLDGLKRNMRSSLSGMTNNLELQVNNLSRRLSNINSRIYTAPKNERALRDITRLQQTTEELYLFLLQKREEAQIRFASTSPRAKIIDSAYTVSQFPIAPKKPIILLGSLLMGLFIPFAFIYANELLNNKVRNKNDLEKLVRNIPVLAELPKILRKDNKLVKQGERTVLAESLRILRTNLTYLINSIKKNKKGNIIFVTSSVPGEGKTFLASNLALIYGIAKKNVLLIGADIRNPKIYQFFSQQDSAGYSDYGVGKDIRGLTDYLFNKSLNIEQIISPIHFDDQSVDVIHSGRIPPNPSELLMNGRFKELLDRVEDKYDYIIVDTAPMMVVTDTLLISNFADQIIYVVRSGITDIKVINYPLKLYEEGKLKRLSFVVNGVKSTDLGYGGKYGYGYGKTAKKWWKL